MEFEPYAELSQIKPDKPVLDLNQGVLYMNGSSIKTIEFEPEPLNIMNIMPKNVFWNIKPMAMSMTAKFKPDFINDRIIQGKPVGPWTMTEETKLQKRKHHKTRINKKWAKRYGYTTIEHIYEVLDLKEDPASLINEQVTYDLTLKLKEARMY